MATYFIGVMCAAGNSLKVDALFGLRFTLMQYKLAKRSYLIFTELNYHNWFGN
jgi:hypothetical protein